MCSSVHGSPCSYDAFRLEGDNSHGALLFQDGANHAFSLPSIVPACKERTLRCFPPILNDQIDTSLLDGSEVPPRGAGENRGRQIAQLEIGSFVLAPN